MSEAVTLVTRWQVLGIEGSDCAWSFVDRMFLANELLDAADAAGKLSAWVQRIYLLMCIGWTEH